MQALKGITVVTLEHAIAAPFATRQLAALSARVIKINRPGSGDVGRGYDQRVRGLGRNRDKKAYGLLIQCEPGFVSITGTPDEPSKAGRSIADISTLEAMGDWMGYPPYDAFEGAAPPPHDGAMAKRVMARLEAAEIANAQVNEMAGPLPTLRPSGWWDDGDPRLHAGPALGRHTEATLAALVVDAAAIAESCAAEAI